MIYLIGGAPRCGKTTLAQILSSELQIPWISVDTLEGIVGAYLPKDKFDEHFPKTVIRRKTNSSNEEMYNQYSSQEIVTAYIQQGKTSHKAIKILISNSIKEGHNYIIEGHQVHPEIINTIQEKYGNKQIKSIVLTRFDIDTIVDACTKNKAKNDWFIQKSKSPAIYPKIATMISEYSKFLEDQAHKYGILTINVDKNFKNTINKANKILMNE